MVKVAKIYKAYALPHEDCNRQKRPQFKGIRKRKWGSWGSEIRMPKSRAKIWLGSYKTADIAARAYDAAVYCLRGPNAKFNFPDSIPSIPSAFSLTPHQIQVAAAKYALDEFSSALPSYQNNNNSNNVREREVVESQSQSSSEERAKYARDEFSSALPSQHNNNNSNNVRERDVVESQSQSSSEERAFWDSLFGSSGSLNFESFPSTDGTLTFNNFPSIADTFTLDLILAWQEDEHEQDGQIPLHLWNF